MDGKSYKDGSAETNCVGCNEPLLLIPGDPCHIKVVDGGKIEGVLCVQCYKREQAKNVQG
jgi:hypothetical protein